MWTVSWDNGLAQLGDDDSVVFASGDRLELEAALRQPELRRWVPGDDSETRAIDRMEELHPGDDGYVEAALKSLPGAIVIGDDNA